MSVGRLPGIWVDSPNIQKPPLNPFYRKSPMVHPVLLELIHISVQTVGTQTF